MAGPYFWVADGGTWDNADTAHWSASDGGAAGAGPPLVTDDVNFTAASSATDYTVTMGTGAACLDMTMGAPASGTITWAGSANMAINGNVSLLSGMTATYSGTITWGGGTSNTWASNTATISAGLLAGAGTSWQFLDAFTTTGSITYAAVGTLDLNGQIVTCNILAGSTGNARTFTAGGGKFVVTGNNATVINFNNINNLTLSDEIVVELSYAGSAGTRAVNFGTLNGTEARALSISIVAGTDTVSFAGNNPVRNLNFTGFSGVWGSVTMPLLYGNLVLSSGMSITNSTVLNFASTSTGRTITTNGTSFSGGLTFNGVGGEWTLQDDCTSAGTVTVTNGNLVLGANDLTCSVFASSNSNAREVVFSSGGKIVTTVTGATTAFNAATTTNLTVTRSGGTIEIGGNTTNVRTVNLGTGISWPAITFTNTTANGGLTFAGTATLKSFAYTGGTAQTFNGTATLTIEDNDGWPSGTAGNVLTIDGLDFVKAGGGSVTVDYVTISNSDASPAGTWFAGANSIDGGGNSGWVFAASAVVDTGQTPAGKPKHQPRYYAVKVEGEEKIFTSIDDLVFFLDTYEVKAKKSMAKKAERDAKRVLRIGKAAAKPNPPQVHISSEVTEINEYVDEVQKKIDRMYWRALAEALARDAEELEDIKFIASLES